MSAPSAARPRAVFTQGSTLRHVLVMTTTGSIGLMAIFVVEFLTLLYISWLRDPAMTAGVGYASQVMFFPVSINIGLSIGVSALVSRSIGRGDRAAARQFAATGLAHTALLACFVTLLMWFFRADLLSLIGANGKAFDAAMVLLNWQVPTIPVLSLGMALPGVLRSIGDAKRSMYVTLFGAISVAILDPILILWLDLGLAGASIAINISRCVWVIVGLWGAIHVHDMLARPTREHLVADLAPMIRIAAPAILTNFAGPVAMAFVLRTMSQFGEAAVAASAIIDRVVPLAFGMLFVMSGVVGPIIGQNYGAKLYHRIRETLTNCFALSAIYVCTVWLLLWLAAPYIVGVFGAQGETARLVMFFCAWGASAWAFLGCLFAANAAFNNLDYPLLSTFFNWGRATLGTMPFAWIGARWYGPEGVILGIAVGAAIFGVAAIAAAYWIARRIEKKPLSGLK